MTSDNKKIISSGGSVDRTVKIWDFKEKKCIHTIEEAHKGF